MDMTISKRDRALLIALAGVLVAAASYWFIYVGFTDKTAVLKNENTALQTRVDVLQELANRQEQMAEDTIANTNEAKVIMDQFPSDAREEDLIMLAVNLQNYAPFVAVDSITIDEQEQRYQFADVAAQTEAFVQNSLPSGTVDQAATDAATDTTDPTTTADAAADPQAATADTTAAADYTPTLYEKDGTIFCLTSYEGLKRAVSYVLDRKDRTGLAVTATYDVATGVLVTGMKVGICYVTGTDKPYIAPEIPYIRQGTDNIFGTISLDGIINEADNAEETEGAE